MVFHLSLPQVFREGIIASLLGGIPVVVIMSAVGMFERLAAFLGLGENFAIGVALHFLISFVYGLPVGVAIYYLKNYRFPDRSLRTLALAFGFAWGVVTWLIAISSMPMVMSGEAFFLGFDPAKIFTVDYLKAISISFAGHTIYGMVTAATFLWLHHHAGETTTAVTSPA